MAYFSSVGPASGSDVRFVYGAIDPNSGPPVAGLGYDLAGSQSLYDMDALQGGGFVITFANGSQDLLAMTFNDNGTDRASNETEGLLENESLVDHNLHRGVSVSSLANVAGVQGDYTVTWSFGGGPLSNPTYTKAVNRDDIGTENLASTETLPNPGSGSYAPVMTHTQDGGYISMWIQDQQSLKAQVYDVNLNPCQPMD